MQSEQHRNILCRIASDKVIIRYVIVRVIIATIFLNSIQYYKIAMGQNIQNEKMVVVENAVGREANPKIFQIDVVNFTYTIILYSGIVLHIKEGRITNFVPRRFVRSQCMRPADTHASSRPEPRSVGESRERERRDKERVDSAVVRRSIFLSFMFVELTHKLQFPFLFLDRICCFYWDLIATAR